MVNLRGTGFASCVGRTFCWQRVSGIDQLVLARLLFRQSFSCVSDGARGICSLVWDTFTLCRLPRSSSHIEPEALLVEVMGLQQRTVDLGHTRAQLGVLSDERWLNLRSFIHCPFTKCGDTIGHQRVCSLVKSL